MKLIKLWDADVKKAYELQNSFNKDEHGFVNNAYGLSFKGFKNYVKMQEDYSRGLHLPDGYVPATVYILEAYDEYVGIFNLRHYLNDFLRNGPGHIGYGISPKYRNKGYASEGLRLVIETAKDIVPEDEIYFSVHKDNPYSLKVQLKNGAYIHHEDEKEYYTRINIHKKDSQKS